MESGKASLLDSHTVNVQSQGHVVDMVHFDTGTLFDRFIYKLIVKKCKTKLYCSSLSVSIEIFLNTYSTPQLCNI